MARVGTGRRWSGRAGIRELLPGLLLVAGVLFGGPASAQDDAPGGRVAADLLESRRAALLERVGSGLGVVYGSALRDIERDYPQDGDFRQDNDFFYLTGLEAPSAALVLVARERGADEAILYLHPRDPAAEAWTGPRLGPGPEASRLTGIVDVRPATRLAADLDSLLQLPLAGGRLLFSGPELTACPELRLPSEEGTAMRSVCVDLPAAEGLRYGSLDEHLAALRLVKDTDELRRLREAIDLTVEGLREAMRAARPGMYEYEIEAVIEYIFRRGGAERVGFPSIVGSGPNSTVLHYDRSRRRTESGDLVVTDVGAELGYYTADITRTFPVSGRFTARQRALYELVLSTQQAAIDAVRPGVTVAALTRLAREHMREHSGDLCAPGSCERYFIHGLSHWLGMDVHDVGSYATPLAPGMVLTIEPGLYIPEESIGIRIEDDVLVTRDGSEVLSAGAPRRPDAIERLMAEPPAAVANGGGPG